jgi:UDP-2,3-diacylglucosamine pyrophosphatase LpxH
VVERFGGHSVIAVHGDLVNRADRAYRAWSRLSRSPVAWGAFGLVPRGRRARLSEWLERRMRTTNLSFKREFPEARVREYAAGFFERGHDVVVLGHFHAEHDLAAEGGRIVVLPEWVGSRRYLRIGVEGAVELVDDRP